MRTLLGPGTLALLALAGCGGAISSTATSGSRSASGRSVRGELVGVNIDPENPTANPPLADLQALGATRVRFTFRADADLAAAFARYDGPIAAYHHAGLAILLILDGETVPLADRPVALAASGRWGAYVAAFAQRAAAIAAHYAGTVDAYEIWNEEDLDDSLPGRHIDAPRYAELLDAAYDAIHGVAGARVVTGGLASGDSGYVAQMGGFRADAIATHPYIHWPGDGVPAGWYPLADHVADYGRFGKPLWFTEWGTNDQQLLPRLIQAFFDHPEVTAPVEQAWFFGWSDTQDPGYGLTTDGSARKPAAWSAFASAGGDAGGGMNGGGNGNGNMNGGGNGNGNGGMNGGAAATGSLAGTVRDAGNGGVIHPRDPGHAAGITIYCAGRSVPIADDGTYRLDGIAPGGYGIAAVNNWNETGWYVTWMGFVTVGSGATTTVDIALTPVGGAGPQQPATPPSGGVRGTVFDGSTRTPIHPHDPGHPTGITVYCAGRQVAIADDGTYEIDDISPGTWGIAAANNWGATGFYATFTDTLSVAAGAPTSYDIYLAPR